MRASSNRLAARYSCSPMLSPPISTSHRPVCSRGGSRCSGRPPPGEAPGGRAQGRSKRSRFMTLSHAATKSCTNFSLRVVAGVDLRDGSELGVRPEDEVDSGAGPLDLAGRAVAALVDVLASRTRSTRCPCRAGSRRSRWSASRAGSVKTPCSACAVVRAEDAQAADEHRHLRSGQGQQARPVDQQLLRPALVARPEVVAEPVRRRLEHGERLDVGLLGDASVRPGENGTCTSWPAFWAACSTAAHPPSTIRSARETFFPPVCEPLKSAWIPSRVCSTVASSAGSLTSQSFCGARRMRAPLAPPRLSLPRNVDADAHAVETSWDTDRPEARIWLFRAAMSAASTSAWSTAGTGSCQISGSAGTSGPR